MSEGFDIPVSKDKHHPGVELRQCLGDEVLAGLGEDGADQPQVEGVGGQREDVRIRPGPLLQWLAGALVVTGPLFIELVARVALVHVKSRFHVAGAESKHFTS